MKVILTTTTENIGRRGDMKEVANGYARNFLLPQNLAIVANDATVHQAEIWQKEEQLRQAKEKEDFQKLSEHLEKEIIVITQKTKNDEGELYGSIGVKEIVETAKQQDINLNKNWIQLAEPLKKIGKHAVNIQFPYGIRSTCNVEIKEESTK